MKTDLDNILTLISATIFSNPKVYASEVVAFVKLTKNLKAARRFEPRLSEARLLMWFENNKDDICAQLLSSDFESWFYGLLRTLDGLPEKDSVLAVMTQISSVNGDAHADVKAWIQLVSHNWKVAA